MPDCMRWFAACGREPLTAIKQHLADCPSCQKDLVETYEVYKAYRYHSGNPYGYLPQDLSGPEEFLGRLTTHWAMKEEEGEHFRQVLKDKFAGQRDEVVRALQRLFMRLHHALNITAMPLKEKQLTLIRLAYQDLLSILGRSPFVFLLGLDHLMNDERTQPLGWLDERWRRVLLPEVGD